MHLSAAALVIAAAFTTIISATPHNHRGRHTHCWTWRTWQPCSHVPTSYTTATTPCTSTATTSTTITTTLTPSTGTITVTSTITSSIVSTSTVPAPVSFLPVQTTLPQGAYNGSGGPDPVNKRGLRVHNLNLDGELTARTLYPRPDGMKKPPGFPFRVTCKVSVPPPTCTATTTTVTSTSTVSPTESFTTVTSTITTTSIASSTTVYAACATNNMIDTIIANGTQYPIDNIIPLPDGGTYPQYEISNTDSAYDCCVFGLNGPNGGIVFGYKGGQCIIGANNGVCPATGQNTNPAEALYEETNSGYVTGNLPCGSIISAGPDSS